MSSRHILKPPPASDHIPEYHEEVKDMVSSAPNGTPCGPEPSHTAPSVQSAFAFSEPQYLTPSTVT